MNKDNFLKRFDWQPGNMTRYDLLFGKTGGRWMISWLRDGGSGGTVMIFDDAPHYSYMMEKMKINVSDATGILQFLEEQGFKVSYPSSSESMPISRTRRIEEI